MATVAGGFWEQYGSSYTPIGVTSALKRRAAMIIDKMKVDRALMAALNGVAPGAAASDTYKRIAANSELGGARTIETVTNVSRVTVAGDVTEIVNDILTYGGLDSNVNVANLDGNPLGTR